MHQLWLEWFRQLSELLDRRAGDDARFSGWYIRLMAPGDFQRDRATVLAISPTQDRVPWTTVGILDEDWEQIKVLGFNEEFLNHHVTVILESLVHRIEDLTVRT